LAVKNAVDRACCSGAVLFEDVRVGLRRGSFEVDGIVRVHNFLRQMEMEGFMNDERIHAWWML